MTNICEICQLYSPTAGCTKLENESCLKEALKLIKPSATNGEVMMKMFLNCSIFLTGNFVLIVDKNDKTVGSFDLDWWNRKWGE